MKNDMGLDILRLDQKRHSQKEYELSDYIVGFVSIFVKSLLIILILTINMTALSIALNCNADSTLPMKYSAGILAFFFGIVYLMINFYSFRLLTKRELCEFDKTRLFPF